VLDDGAFTATILSEAFAVGSISVPPCTPTPRRWFAEKRRGPLDP
jgi:hypothetical protein